MTFSCRFPKNIQLWLAGVFRISTNIWILIEETITLPIAEYSWAHKFAGLAVLGPLSAEDFARIVERGLGPDDDFLPRVDQIKQIPGFQDPQVPFQHFSARDRVTQLTNRAVRDRNFRKNVLRAYGERCAITGRRLINGGGRAEVEAAHIRPVEHDGPDNVSNGLALSGTAHWMFDRGLVGFADDLSILVSRHSNDLNAVTAMINSSGKLLSPERPANRPRTEFVTWHRENCFKH